MIRRIFPMLLCMSLSPYIHAEAQTFSSTGKPGMLVELYTSEGCSSCPPAEARLNTLKNNSKLWHDYIPVAFHVDYWDYIGWKDRFAHTAHEKRQRYYANYNKRRTIYTPSFILNGKYWRPGSFTSNFPAPTPSIGELELEVDKSQVMATYKIPDSIKKLRKSWVLHTAVLGMNLHSDINAGENEGRNSNHEFVVVGYRAHKSASLNWNVSLPRLHNREASSHALVAWVSADNNPEPLRAVGGYLSQ